MVTQRFYSVCFLLAISGILFSPHSVTLRGKVVDKQSKGIENAFLKLVNANVSATSDSNGNFSITVPTKTLPPLRKKVLPAPTLKGNSLYFVVDNNGTNTQVSIYSLNGKLMYKVLEQSLTEGLYSINPVKQPLKAATYLVKLQLGKETSFFKLPVITTTTSFSIRKQPIDNISGTLQKRKEIIDTLKVSRSGYAPAAKPISFYEDSLTITLDALEPSYHLNPPNPCYNKFYVQNCIPGDPNSACSGNCRVANSCSPPEDPSKSDLPKTFICPRFMLFSTEMRQAAKDDADLYGWGDDPPFNYGVVGHDPDVGGVDDGPSSCCQCYQIVFVNPEPSSPKPPELPYPKPLIVQSFNTAASGPKGFDVFMGAGGYGAFNACYDDPAFNNNTKFGEFMYEKYPYQNPGSGGISFLRYPDECQDGWPPTVAGLESDECRQKIEQMCDQAVAYGSEQITEDTRYSCIESNKVGSLYHQNWEVMVKRVRCPENLTRVTGCRLIENHLPLPSPNVKTPADALANGTFRSGYHTTTMQDCCKPTCAWTDWVVNYDLPADGEWNSFYSCDNKGVPITK
ncbi:MAG: T9SS type A sorting domain-containing protein [Fibrobacter sp.]|nr:T9SS type A sorting domain-containing protein [Fibrobacter sp.]